MIISLLSSLWGPVLLMLHMMNFKTGSYQLTFKKLLFVIVSEDKHIGIKNIDLFHQYI